MQTNSVICADALTVRVDDRTLVDNLNFNVGKGEVFALLGGNGAGKSITLKTFLGLMKASSSSCSDLTSYPV
jgi:ABC-2 type transport system ATP-binding protein